MIKTPSNVSKLLPPDARELLVKAAEAPRYVRDEQIEQATATIKTKYPQFFQKEPVSCAPQ